MHWYNIRPINVCQEKLFELDISNSKGGNLGIVHKLEEIAAFLLYDIEHGIFTTVIHGIDGGHFFSFYLSYKICLPLIIRGLCGAGSAYRTPPLPGFS